MSAVFYCLAILFVIINGQTFEDCGSQTITVGSNANQRTLTIQLERDLTAEEVRITLTGPTDRWFGFVIGQGTMDGGYGVYGSGIDPNFVVTEQFLRQYGGGEALTSSGTATTSWDDQSGTNGLATIVLTRPFAVSGSGDYYDFTNVLGAQCTGDDMAFGGALGSSNNYAKHQSTNPNQVFTSQCSCEEPTTTTVETTAEPTSDPTTEPTIPGGDADTTMATTDVSTSDMGSTDETYTSTEDDGYELCAMKELLGVTLYVSRNPDEQMVRIMMEGPNAAWFGYGFGSAKMTGAYAVTVEADNSANLPGFIRERTLDKSAAPGTLLTPSGSAEVINDGSSAMAVLERAYAATNDGFDFTEFLKCNEESVDLIAAIGTGTKMGGHSSRVDAETLTRLDSCICDTDSDEMSSTMPGGDGSSANNIFKGINIIAIVSACIYLIMT